jgi:PleD family two-component response regulator
MESLFDSADNALRKAKELGRDRVEIAGTGRV